MGLREQIINILRSNETQRINFSFTGSTGAIISVDANGFRRVAKAIEENSISVKMGGAKAGWASYSAFDEGDLKANTFNIGENNYSSREFNALMVHESVHAIFDLMSTTIPWVDNEAAAYIAQGYYLRNSGFKTERLDADGMPYLGRMIVDEIRSGGEYQAFWIDELRSSLLADENYHSYIRGTFTGDG